MNVVDDRLRKPEHGDRPTIGILLAADRDDVAVQYYLQGLTTPGTAAGQLARDREPHLPPDERYTMPERSHWTADDSEETPDPV